MAEPNRPVLVALALAIAVLPHLETPALAQRDAITERLIRELRPGPSRGMRSEPYAVGPANQEPAGTARRDLPAGDGAAVPHTRGRPPSTPADAPRLASPAPIPVRTTAPPGTPASSLTVLFDTGSATLASASQLELDGLGRALRSEDLAGSRFRIEGHTDRVGSEASNQLLSERRAAAVRDYLVQRYGIAEARLMVAGMGESQTLVPTPDETPNPRNRRVQVLNVGALQN